MKSFSIDSDNNITAFASATESKAAGGESFTTEAEWSKLTADWPTRRLVEVWNSIPGFTPVHKFTSRRTAVDRIWKAIQSLGNDADQTPGVSSRPAMTAKRNGKVRRPNRAESSTGKADKGLEPALRDGTKGARILKALQQPTGATLKQLMRITNWQAHSVRGYLSGHVGKKKGLKVRSFGRDGERVYELKG